MSINKWFILTKVFFYGKHAYLHSLVVYNNQWSLITLDHAHDLLEDKNHFIAEIFCDIGRQTQCTTNCTCLPHYNSKCVNFRQGGKPEYHEKNPWSTGEINYDELNSHEMQTRPGFAFSVVRGTMRKPLVPPVVWSQVTGTTNQKYVFVYKSAQK